VVAAGALVLVLMGRAAVTRPDIPHPEIQGGA